jgi:hypothetical protein
MNNIEALQRALDALGPTAPECCECAAEWEIAITSIRQAIEQAQQAQPVAWQERQARRMRDGVVTEWTDWYPCRYRTIDEARAEACDHIPYEWRPLYTAPPPRQPLTDEQIINKADRFDWSKDCAVHFARAIEAAHGIRHKRQHITDGSTCWCNPETDYVDPKTGAAVVVHKEPQ